MKTGIVQAAARLLAAALLIATTAAAAAEYPERPLKIINPFAVGGSGDTMQRLFAQKLSVLGALYGKLPWDHANDLVPVTMYARAPFAILVSPQPT